MLRKVNQSTKKPADGVLGPSWEGPYKVLHSFGNGAYKLGYPDGRVVGKSWKAEHLQKYYQLANPIYDVLVCFFFKYVMIVFFFVISIRYVFNYVISVILISMRLFRNATLFLTYL